MIFRYEMWDHTNMTGKQKGDHMNQSMIAQNIRANGLRATAQRILIYQYLFEHRTAIRMRKRSIVRCARMGRK